MEFVAEYKTTNRPGPYGCFGSWIHFPTLCMLRLCQRLTFPNPIAPPRSFVHSSSSSSKNYPFLRTSPEISRLRFAMAYPSQAVSSRGPITHVIFDMDGLLLGNFIKHFPCIVSLYNLFVYRLRFSVVGLLPRMLHYHMTSYC